MEILFLNFFVLSLELFPTVVRLGCCLFPFLMTIIVDYIIHARNFLAHSQRQICILQAAFQCCIVKQMLGLYPALTTSVYFNFRSGANYDFLSDFVCCISKTSNCRAGVDNGRNAWLCLHNIRCSGCMR